MFDQPKQLQDNLFNATFPLTLGGLTGSFPGAAVAADGFSGGFPGAPLGAGSEGYPVNDLWPPLQMPAVGPFFLDCCVPNESSETDPSDNSPSRRVQPCLPSPLNFADLLSEKGAGARLFKQPGIGRKR